MGTTDALFERQLIRLSPIDHEKDPAVVSRWTADPLLRSVLGRVPFPLSTEAVRKVLEKIEKEMDESEESLPLHAAFARRWPAGGHGQDILD